MGVGWHQKQKKNGTKLILTWFGPRACWKKYRNGKTKYFQHPNSALGYEAAVAEYHSWVRNQRDTRTHAAEYRHHIDLLGKCVDWYDRFGVPEEEHEIHREVVELHDRLKAILESQEEMPCPASCLPDGTTLPQRQMIMALCAEGIVATQHGSSPFNSQFGSLSWSIGGFWGERLRQLETLVSRGQKQPQTVGHQVQRFLDFKEMQVLGGVIKPRTWATLEERLAIFVEWIKSGTHVSTIDGTTLTRFYEWLLSKSSWGHLRRKGVFNNARQWIRWAWRQDDVELETLPKNIESGEFVFLTHLDDTGVAKKTRTDLLWTLDEFSESLSLVPDDFRLFLLLMLNCGFTNVDVATLLKSEVQLDEGRIIRQRTKTRRHAHPPIVNYQLWPQTVSLLREQWGNHPSLALTNRVGNPLAVSRLSQVNGKTRATIWTSIGRRYGDMKKTKPKMPRKQLMFLRKSGSTKLRSERKFMSLDSLYLGHSWATVADKHYNAFDGQPYAPLDEAIAWLGSKFNQT